MAQIWTLLTTAFGVLQEQVYKTSDSDATDVTQRLIELWSNIPKTVVDEAIEEWRLRLWAYLKEKGCHFKHTV